MPIDLQRVQSVFQALVELPPAERAAVLERECGDAELRRYVETLLQAHDDSGELPAAHPKRTGAHVPAGELGPVFAGRYKLREKLGEGGMGVVFVAEQTEPVQRRVALKVIRAGLDTHRLLARFEQERQALALMDHPNIAKVFDAGVDEGQRPYFAMELVKGLPLTKYCDDAKLSPRQRLELFLPVCQAVQHAHQKGIIHRDLKPSNILVGLYDGQPVPKVIDFGVAKATGPQLTEHSVYTEVGSIIGTLEYMSPEQAELNNLDIDTRSDIYALGVILYELLTGAVPFSRQELEQAGLAEMLRVIKEVEPPKPSTKLSHSDTLPSIAAHRQMEPRKLTALVRGELDWIVMKALEKDRGRRYETANGLAMDVQRYLAGEPVLAAPASQWYRLRKLVRRHQAGLLTTAALLLVVLLAGGGIGAVLWERAAQHAARRATTERIVSVALARAAELSAQAQQMPNGTSAEAAAVLVAWQKAQDALAQAEAALTTGADDDLLRQRVADLQTQLDKGQARALRKEKLFRDLDEARLARSVWVDHQFDYAGSVAQYAAAFAAYDLDVTTGRKDELARRIAAEEPEVREALLVALGDWAWAAQWGTRWSVKDLLELARTADSDAWRKRHYHAAATRDGSALRNLSVEARRSSLPPSSLSLLALHLLKEGEHEESLALLRWGRGRHPADFWLHFELGNTFYRKGETPTAVELEEAIGCFRAALALRPQASAVHNNLGAALRDKGQLDEAIAEYREAIRLTKDDAVAHHNLGIALKAKGQLDEAIAAFREAIRLKKDFAPAHNKLGGALADKGQLDKAIAEFREAIRINKDEAVYHFNLGLALYKKGRLDEAIAAYREAIRLKFKDNAEAHINLANALGDKGQLDEAIAAYREAIRLKKDYAEAHGNLGSALHGKGRLPEAIAAFREAIRLKKDFAEAHCNLGSALLGKGQLDEAIDEYREAIRLKKDYAKAHCNLGIALYNKGQFDEAIDAFREAIRLKEDYAEAHNNLGLALRNQGRFGEALAALQTAHKLFSQRPGGRSPSAAWVRQVEQLIELDAKLAKVLKGETAPANARERLQLAFFCQHYKKLYAASAAWYLKAFAAEPKAAEDLKAAHRYNAARAAALASSGKGHDAGKLNDDERTRLRRQALDWLRADLAIYAKQLPAANAQDRTKLQKQMGHWLRDDDLIALRDAAALAKLAADERAAWLQLWADVEKLLRETRGAKKE
jgi:tetratricopeptide (TPR) repeat protein